MKNRRAKITESIRRERNKKIIADYEKLNAGGKFTMSVKEIAIKYAVSIPLIYKILEKNDK